MSKKPEESKKYEKPEKSKESEKDEGSLDLDMSGEWFTEADCVDRLGGITDKVLEFGKLRSLNFDSAGFPGRESAITAMSVITRVLLASNQCVGVNLSGTQQAFDEIDRLEKPSNFSRLIKALNKNPVQTVVLRSLNINFLDLKELSKVLSSKESLEVLDLSYNSIFSTMPMVAGHPPTGHLSETLPIDLVKPINGLLGNSSLTSLKLINVNLLPDITVEFVEGLKISSIRYLDLSHNYFASGPLLPTGHMVAPPMVPIGSVSRGFTYFADYVASSKTLLGIKLGFIGMTFDGFHMLLRLLKLYNNQTLEELDLNGNNNIWNNYKDYKADSSYYCFTEKTKEVFKLLSWKSETLVSLDLSSSFNCLSSEHAKELIKTLGESLVGEACPKKLSLSYNNINDGTLVYMINTFLSPRLIELDLSFNDISKTSRIMLDKILSPSVMLVIGFTVVLSFKNIADSFDTRAVEKPELVILRQVLPFPETLLNLVLECNFGEGYKDQFHASCKFWVCKKPPLVKKIKGKVDIERDFIKIIEGFVFAQGGLITEYCKPLVGEEGSEVECGSLG